ncbi:MAG: HAMP domain-containing sensor histidine kinase, partial [Planctomycetota bacterium]|nr:HAMP domain-containing sensor histidine kinase [Planctomycetota bacterium]
VAFSEKGIPEDLEHLASFPGELSFFSLALERHRWHEILDGARRPFVFAGALIGILGLILASSLLLIYRGLQRERALSRVKTEFVAGVSHELKTPLALIHLCGETLLLDRVRGKEQSEKYLRVITRETMRLSHLITNVLDFSSIEAGKKTYDLEPCDLSEVIRETIEHYRFHLEEKGFECSEDIPPTLPLVLADQQAVAQALVNLLQNGVRYSTDTRRLEVTGRVENGDVKISVRDFGVGISPSDQDKIWDDYFRTRQARALGTRGSGLGLSLVQHVMIAHGGNIELRSDLGEGSTFTLVFPVARGASREVSEVPNEQQDSRH